MKRLMLKSVLSVEPVAIGSSSTRLSSAIVMLLCLIPALTTVLFGGVDSISWVFITILCFVVLVMWAIETWRAGALLLNTSLLPVPLLALGALGVAQLTLGVSLNPFGTRILVGRLVIFAVFFAACLTFLNTEKRLRAVVVFLIIFGAAMAFFGALQWLAGPDSIYGLRTGFQAIPFGPFVNQHHFATFMEMTGGLSLGLLLGSIERDKKVLVGIALVTMLIAMVLTGSRGAMISFMAVTGTVLLLRAFLGVKTKSTRTTDDDAGPIPRKVSAAIGTAAIIVGVLGAIIFIGGDASLTRGIGLSAASDDVTNGRLEFWSVALRIFTANPLLGAGLDAYGLAFPRYDTSNGGLRVDYAHNDYLQTLADAGIVGAVIVSSFVFLFFRQSLRVIRAAGAGFRRDAAIGAFAGCCGLLVHSIFDFPLRTWSNSFVFLLLVAVATVAIRSADAEAPVHKRRKRRSTAREQGSPSSRTAART